MCDRFIQSKESQILPVNYYGMVIKIANLWKFNDRHGRGEGDRALKMVADIIQQIFHNRKEDFIAHNGSGVFMIFGEGESRKTLEQKMALFDTVLSEKDHELKERVLYQYGICVAGDEKIFDIRKLNRSAFADMKDTIYGEPVKEEDANE